jgi:hypothetical protein
MHATATANTNGSSAMRISYRRTATTASTAATAQPLWGILAEADADAQIIPVEELGKAAFLFDAVGRWALGADRPLVLTVHHRRSTKILSWQRPRPSMLIPIS